METMCLVDNQDLIHETSSNVVQHISKINVLLIFNLCDYLSPGRVRASHQLGSDLAGEEQLFDRVLYSMAVYYSIALCCILPLQTNITSLDRLGLISIILYFRKYEPLFMTIMIFHLDGCTDYDYHDTSPILMSLESILLVRRRIRR